MEPEESPRSKLRGSLSLRGLRSNYNYPGKDEYNWSNYEPLMSDMKNREIVKEFPRGRDKPVLSSEYLIKPNGSNIATHLRASYAYPLKTEGFRSWINASKLYTGVYVNGRLLGGALSENDKVMLQGYTYMGDVLVNNYLRGTLKPPFEDEEKAEYLATQKFIDVLFWNYINDNYDLLKTRMKLPKKGFIMNIPELIFDNYEFFDDVSNVLPIIDIYKNDLIRIISRAPPLPAPLTVYRGFKSEDHVTDLEFSNIDFISTSLDMIQAIKFSLMNDKTYKITHRGAKYFGGVYEITVTPRVPCVFMGFISFIPGEYEVLLPPGLKFTFDPRIYYKVLPQKGRGFFDNGDRVAVIHVTVDLPDAVGPVGGARFRHRITKKSSRK
jgi:hypothetical protein